MEKEIIELIKTVKIIAPELWNILVRQQIIEAISGMVTWILSLGGVFFGIWVYISRPKWALDELDTNIGGAIILFIAATLCAISTGGLIIKFLPMLINTERDLTVIQ
jgi:hypothetical protein